MGRRWWPFGRSEQQTFDAPTRRGPQFQVDVPAEMLEAMTGGGAIDARISRREALQVPAVMRARNLICGTLARLPLRYHGPDFTPAPWSLFEQIDPDIPNVVVKAMTLEDMLFEGIAWWRVTDWQWNGYPKYAQHIEHERVHVSGGEWPPRLLSPDQTIPLDGEFYIDGVRVNDPDRELIRFDSPNPPLLVHAARAIRTALKLDRAAALAAVNPLPLGVFVPKEGADPLSAEPGSAPDGSGRSEIEMFLDDWEKAAAARSWGYLAGVEPKDLQWDPKRLQLAEQRQHAVLEIARATGLDPEDLGVSTTSRTYQNSEQRRQDLIDFNLAAWITAFEERLSMGDVTPRGYTAKIDTTEFVRGDTKTRMETYKIGQEVGAYTEDEIRTAEHKPPRSRPSPIPQPAPAPAQPGEQLVAAERPKLHAVNFERDLPDHWTFAVDTPPWGSIGESDYTPEQWRRACVIDTGLGDPGSKGRYKLPVKTPGGALHRGGVHAAAGGHGLSAVTGISPDKRRSAARALIRLYGEIGDEPPESLRRMAGMEAEDDHAVSITFDLPSETVNFRANPERRTVSGLAVPWNRTARSGGRKWKFPPGSLHWSEVSRVKANRSHDHDTIIGKAVRLEPMSVGLDASIQLGRSPEAKRAFEDAEDGILDGFSIEIDFDSDGDGFSPDPADRSVNLVKRATLRAIALTPTPAFDDARLSAVAASRDHTEGTAHGRGQNQDQGRRHSGRPVVRVRSRRVR